MSDTTNQHTKEINFVEKSSMCFEFELDLLQAFIPQIDRILEQGYQQYRANPQYLFTQQWIAEQIMRDMYQEVSANPFASVTRFTRAQIVNHATGCIIDVIPLPDNFGKPIIALGFIKENAQ